MSSADTTGELQEAITDIVNTSMGHYDAIQKVTAYVAAQKQRWETEARLRGRIAEVNKLGVNGLLGQWDVDRIVDKYEQELAALDGVIGENNGQ